MVRRRILSRLVAALAYVLLPLCALGQENSLATDDVALPAGYVIEPVLTGLTYPTSIAFGPDGSLYVAESGYAYGPHWAEDRILNLRPDGRVFAVASGFRGPIMGITFRENQLYVAHRGTISVVDLTTLDRSRRRRDIVTGLPVVPNGGHYNSRVAFGPDGKMYLAVGTVTNSGVPGADEVLFGWLPDLPWMRDAPARDVTLAGPNYPSPDVLGPDPLKIVSGHAFLPFGTRGEPGQTIPAHPRPTAAVYRANPDGSELEVYAWGIRSPFGFAFGPDGRLYMTNHEMDDRGARPAAEAPDTLLEIRQNAFYGWPDYIAGTPITDERFKPKFPLGRRPEFVMQNHPEVAQPLVRFEPHAADMGFDWSRSERFGFNGEMFLAEFGDGSPITTGLQKIAPRGYRVIRVNPAAGTYEPFMTIQSPGRASTRGPKHPIDVRFDPSGENLYLLDFGLMSAQVSLQRVGIKAVPRTGTVWRIRRQDAAAPAAPGVARVEGGRLLSWWMARPLVLTIQQSMRTALAHARRAQAAPLDLQRYQHRLEARRQLEGIGTLATFALQRIDEPNVVDDGTRLLLLSVRDWAAAAEPLHLRPDDRTIQEVNRWVERTEFPEKEHLRQNYAVPGRWQRPVEQDVKP